MRELDRLSKMPAAAAEYTVSRTYLDWIVALPWTKRTDEVIDLPKTRAVLDDEHYGLEQVKERILEYLAVRKLNPGVKGPILCFVGPPGVGKTSLARSIAQSLGRKFVRVSPRRHARRGRDPRPPPHLHRRPARPDHPGPAAGRVAQSGLHARRDRQARHRLPRRPGLGAARGARSRAEQRPSATTTSTCRSICRRCCSSPPPTSLDPIPPALRDRMEVIELPGYTEEEKLEIARGHLVARAGAAITGSTAKQPGLRRRRTAHRSSATTPARPGVRNLEREIGAICRKVARRRADGQFEQGAGHAGRRCTTFLGAPTFLDEEIAERTKRPGVATGLAWTPVGGEVLFIEAIAHAAAAASLTLTGQLGDVMKESARAALSWVRAARRRSGASTPTSSRRPRSTCTCPSGAIPKDGPSAGVTMATALVSELTGRPVRGDVAMTGEITLSGKVLPVGGIKEKVLAAKRAGVTRDHPAAAEREERQRGSRRRSARRADHPPRRHHRRGAAAGARAGATAGREAPAPVGCTPPCNRRRPVRVVYSSRYHLDFGAHVFPTGEVPAGGGAGRAIRPGARRVRRAGARVVGRPGAGPHAVLPRRRGARHAHARRDGAARDPVLAGHRRGLPADDRRHDHRGAAGARRP